jgi:hypothetical protein
LMTVLELSKDHLRPWAFILNFLEIFVEYGRLDYLMRC